MERVKKEKKPKKSKKPAPLFMKKDSYQKYCEKTSKEFTADPFHHHCYTEEAWIWMNE